tara:strand:+ start:34 stop:2328 length:2295 start_codon:yes stop_codon:yes gene_type:complete
MYLKKKNFFIYLSLIGIIFYLLSLKSKKTLFFTQKNNPEIENIENNLMDSIEPSCINIKNESAFKKIKNISILIPNSKGWNKNLFRAITAKSKAMILSKYKKNFDGYVKYKVNNDLCNLKARIRISGGRKSHIKIKNNSIISSLDIHLKEGNINGFTKFKLFLPRERNFKSEIITSILFRELGFISPRTSFIDASINGIKQKYIIQEKPAKEMLENHKRRESAILGINTQILYSLRSQGNRLNDPYMSMIFPKLVNHKWAKKNNSSFIISFNAVKNFSKVFQGSWSDNWDDHITFSDTKLSGGGKKSFNKLSEFRLLAIAMGAEHAIYNNNRKFYYDPLFNNLYPIYYDGNSQVGNNYLITKQGIFYMQNIIKEINIKTIDELIRKLKKINKPSLVELFDNSNLKLDYSDTNLILNNIIRNLYFLKNNLPENKDYYPVKAPHYKYQDLPVEYGIAFSNDNRNYTLCQIKEKKCKKIKLSFIEGINLLNGKFSLDKKKYFYVGSNYKDYMNGEIMEENLNIKNYLKNDLKFYYFGNPLIKVNYQKKILNISINNESDKIIFVDDNLKDWSIFINNKNLQNKNESRFDSNLLTALLTIQNSTLDNINIRIDGGIHEDSLNIINSKGTIDKIIINNSFQDSIDFDFSELKINNIEVNNSGNDCLDLSSGEYNINSLKANNCFDKGISVGEASISNFSSINISNVKVGIASKDSSLIKIDRGIVNEYITCLAIYRKKQEFMGAKVEVANKICPNKDISVQMNSSYILK